MLDKAHSDNRGEKANAMNALIFWCEIWRILKKSLCWCFFQCAWRGLPL